MTTTYVFVSPRQVVALPPTTAADYCTLGELKAWLHAPLPAGDTSLDAVLADCITDASRIIDGLCRVGEGAFSPRMLTRTFDVRADPPSGAPSAYGVVRGDPLARPYYFGQVLCIPALQSVTSLKTDEDGDGVYEVTWATADYQLHPPGGPPYRAIYVHPTSGRYAFPVGARRVQVLGSWGETDAIPAPIRRVALELATRKWQRASAPFGVMGSVDTGLVRVGSDEEAARKSLEATGFVGRGKALVFS